MFVLYIYIYIYIYVYIYIYMFDLCTCFLIYEKGQPSPIMTGQGKAQTSSSAWS